MHFIKFMCHYFFFVTLVFLKIVIKMEKIQEDICLIVLILIKLHKDDEIV